ncbi:tetratricopeptide-like helical domain-containing protein [Artemisia annua]|uniref:Tetratricopeptide-like helical domain-containing protein n=1 Tax=Artemisia annua TaxID=35608 RepID=A0A2U1L6J3_ARTAN|nr:tetratricopeptide-like helical domain-containing protein [Artemisia annua]
MAMCMHIPSTTINHKTFLNPLTPTTKPHFSSPHKTHLSKHNIVQFNHVHQKGTLKIKVFEKLNDKELDPVQILENDGDWSSGLFWAVVGFLNQTSRSKCVIKVFDRWISKDGSRVSEFNYERIIRLLVEEGLVGYAVMALKDMKDIHGI